MTDMIDATTAEYIRDTAEYLRARPSSSSFLDTDDAEVTTAVAPPKSSRRWYLVVPLGCSVAALLVCVVFGVVRVIGGAIV